MTASYSIATVRACGARTGRDDRWRDVGLEGFEVRGEHARQGRRLRVVRRRIRPRVSGDEHGVRHAGTTRRHIDVEHRVAVVAHRVETARQRRGDHRARQRNLHARSRAVRAAGPSGVHQPDARSMTRNALAKHARVARGRQRQKRRGEAGAERRLGLRHAALRAGHLRRVSGQEVIHRAVRRETRNRRQHAKRVSGQHHDVGGMAALPRRHRVVDERQRIRRARVFGQAIVVQVEYPRRLVHHDVFEHGAEAPRRREDLGLGLAGQPNRLRVAAALEIENAARAPAVFVVADKLSTGVARKRRLARAGQSEKERDVAGAPHIGRAVHRQHILLRKKVVENRLNTDFLNRLARVARARNEHEPAGKS